MKGKNFLWILGFGLMVMAVGLVGCGDVPIESKIYHYPNWTPDGRIIAIKNVIRETKGMWGNYDTTYDKSFITTISSDGATETDLFEISDYAYPSEVVCSPDGKKIGYISHPEYKLAIINYDGTGKYIIPGVSGVSHFDWSPDSTKIAYSNDNGELHVFNIDGTNNNQIATSAEAVAWRVGGGIAFEYLDNGYLYLGRINTDGTSKESYGNMSVYSPQISNNNNIIYGLAMAAYRKLDVSTNPPKEEILINKIDFIKPRIAFDEKKLIGSDLDQQDIVGIWIINIDGTGSKRLR